MLELLSGPLAVDQEHAARLYVTDNREALRNIGRVMAGDKVSLVDIIGRTDRMVAETQMRNGHAAGLLGVVLEVRLYILVGVVADDLDGVLVRTNRAVAAKAPEFAFGRAFRRSVRGGDFGQGGVGHVVHDADGKLALGRARLELLVNSEYRGRGRILGAQAVAAADNSDIILARIRERGDNVHIERVALRAGFLGAVEDSDLLRSRRDGFEKLVRSKRAVQADFDQADLLAVGVQVIDDFLCNVADGAHRDDHAVGVLCAVIVEQLVVGAELGVDLAHILLNDARDSVIILVRSLAVLEEDVAVLVGTAHDSALGVQGALAERIDRVHVAHLGEVVIIPDLDLLDFVGGTEAVKEVDERHAALDGGEVRNRGEIHDLLRVGLGEHRKAGLAAGHNVGVVAEDVQRMGRYGTGGNMEYAGQKLAGDLVHIRDHQEQALGSGVGGSQRACREGAVHGACRARLGLHFNDLDGRAEDVLLTGGSPLVNAVCHGARGGDRVDPRYFRERIGYVRGSSIAVHGLHFSCHD